MKRVYILNLIFYILTGSSFGQQEAANWYFGYEAGLSFASGQPVVLQGGKVNVSEGSASISDINGNLLFYTDGIDVWNKEHQQMPNGNGLMGGTSSTQAALIVPHPGQSNLYFLFTVSDIPTDGLRYSIIDMSADLGRGAVTSTKNVLLFEPVTEKLTGVMNTNSNETWVMAHELNSNKFLAYRITELGINSVPVTSSVGSSQACNNCNIGAMKFSPDASHLAMAVNWAGDFVEVFDFNDETGTLSNPVKLNIENPYGIEFSPDNSKLYVSTENGIHHLYQYDLSGGTQNLASTEVIIKATKGYAGALQLAPDGKIYWARAITTSYLSVIDEPNAPGLACSYRDTAVKLSHGYSSLGLPNFLQNYLEAFSLSITGKCYGDSTSFSIKNISSIDSISWDFNDPLSGINNASKSLSPVHLFSSAGNYLVKMILHTQGKTKHRFFSLLINEAPIISFSGNSMLCQGDKTTIKSEGGIKYQWEGNTNECWVSIQPSKDTVLTVTGWNKYACKSTANHTVRVNPIPFPPTVINSTICTGETAELLAIVPFPQMKVNWFEDKGKNKLLMSDARIFHPIVAASGIHTYYCSAMLNGCESESVEGIIKVNARPHVTIEKIKETCINAYSFELTEGKPEGGMYSGEAVYGKRFYPSYSEKGTREITYTYTTKEGCSNTALGNITVNNCDRSTFRSNNESDFTIISMASGNKIMLHYNEALFEILKNNSSSITIYDNMGKVICNQQKSASVDLKEQININTEVKGIYIFEIKAASQLIRKKFVI